MNITIVGSGYVGLVSGACLAQIGHNIIFYDINTNKIEQLQQGKIPIYEPGLDSLLQENKNRIIYTSNEEEAFTSSEIIMSAVGTPMGEFFQADLSAVKAVAKTFSKYLDSYKIFVNKSTVPVGTCEMITEIIENEGVSSEKFDVISNPEFLREGCAIEDFRHPERIVIGTNCKRNGNIAKEKLQELYNYYEKNENSQLLFMDQKSSELTKYAANSMLATRISFMNEIANYCDLIGANVSQISKAIGLDSRIGPKFLEAGAGYGGSCFPKDVAALIHSGSQVEYNFSLLQSVEEINKAQRVLPVKKLSNHLPLLENKTIALLGIAFKPETDDIREAASLYCIDELLQLGANVIVYDPIAAENLKTNYPKLNIEYTNSSKDAINKSDGAIILTDWQEFKNLNPQDFIALKDKVIIDSRNIYANRIEEFKENFTYENIGNN